MSFLRNISIKGKLFISFFIVLAITAFIAIYGAVNLAQVDNEYTYILDYPFVRYSILRDIEVGMMDARRTMNRAAMYIHDPDDPLAGISGQEAHFFSVRDNVDELLLAYRVSTNGDRNLDATERASTLSRVDMLETAIHRYFNYYIANLMLAAKAGDEAEAIRLVRQGVATVNEAYEHFFYLFDLAYRRIDDTSEALGALSLQTLYILIALASLGLIIGIVVAITISSMITKPIYKVVDALSDVANGKLNVNLDLREAGKDEVGVLTKDVCILVEAIKDMIEDISKINYEVNEVGDVDYRVDENKYDNSFKEMVVNINKLLNNQVDDMLGSLNVLNNIANGDFNVVVGELPGKKAILPQTIRTVVSNIKELYESALFLADSAAKGKFDVNMDASKFKGNWQELVNTLNNLIAAVEEPLSAIESSLFEMQKGNFGDSKITKTYQGTFESVKHALNTTEDTVMSYIKDISDILSLMAKGDMTVEINRDYIGAYAPIKQALKEILSSLNQSMSGIHQASDQVLLGASQLSQSAMHLADGSAKQTGAIEELTASMEMINNKAGESAGSANNASERALRSSEFAKQGEVVVDSLLSSMDQLKSSSEGISKIIKVISDIAFQTNLLALNASVEAARAGEHGRGFSVVAYEVRTLAGRSQEATSDTEAIIAEDIEHVAGGIEAANEVAESFSTIMKDISEISNIVSGIADMSADQVDSIAAVNNSVAEISMVIQDNSATAEQSAAASQELNSQAETLKEMISFFKIKNV